MPVIDSPYRARGIFKNADVATIYCATLRKLSFPAEKRQRVELKDGDFIDLDRNFFPEQDCDKILIILHGLGGNAQRPYIRGMAKKFVNNGWDTAAINFRSCSGESNRLFKSYHAGGTEDLAVIINFLLKENRYNNMALVGFSLGGNLLLKYLGENRILPSAIKAATAISTPCDLEGSLKALTKRRNFIYSRRFVKKLKTALLLRQKNFPDELDTQKITACNSLLAIDELYTSKAHGFKNAADYYQKCSSLQFLPTINIPTLLLNAANDSFLSPTSYPVEEAKKSAALHLEIPPHGGHLGFAAAGTGYYHEERAYQFCSSHLPF